MSRGTFGGADNLYRKRADGSGDEEQLTRSDDPLWPSSWSRDGQSVVFAGMGPNGNFDISMLALGDKKVQPLLNTTFREADGAVSPDGRWLAYTSNESGRLEVYIRPFPTGAGRWQVSDAGGGLPRWAGTGRELFYRVDDGIMVASIDVEGDSLRTGKPVRLFTGPFRGGVTGVSIGGNIFADYDVTSDGQRFIMFPATETESTNRGIVTLVTQWFDELSRTFAKSR